MANPLQQQALQMQLRAQALAGAANNGLQILNAAAAAAGIPQQQQQQHEYTQGTAASSADIMQPQQQQQQHNTSAAVAVAQELANGGSVSRPASSNGTDTA
jgi:hypothetical protein